MNALKANQISNLNDTIHTLVGKLAVSYAAPLLFGLPRSRERAVSSTQNASCSLLETGNRRLLVTNDHVLAAYDDLKEQNNDAFFQVGNSEPFQPQVLDRDAYLDIATISADHINPQDVADRGGVVPFTPIRPTHWPLDPVVEGDLVSFGGWPQRNRFEHDDDFTITSGSWSLSAAQVIDVTPAGFTCRLDRDEWRDSIGRYSGSTDDTNLGGLSGCPAFTLRGLSFDFVGILFQYSIDFDVMRFRSARIIGSDGLLERRNI